MARKPAKRCPPELLDVIDEANLIPYDQSMVERFRTKFETTDRPLRDAYLRRPLVALDNDASGEESDRAAEENRRIMDTVRKEFYRRVNKDIPARMRPLARRIGQYKTPVNVNAYIADFTEKRDFLLRFIDALRNHAGPSHSTILRVNRPILLSVSNNHFEQIDQERFYQNLFACDASDIARIVFCPECRLFVWPKKRGSITCGTATCVMKRANRARKKDFEISKSSAGV